MADKEERIRIRAYQIWEREGRLEGRHEHNWEEARREIEAEDAARGGGGTAAAGARSRRDKAAGSTGQAKPKSGTGIGPRGTPATKTGVEKVVRAQAAETTVNVLKRPRPKAS